MGRYCLGCYFSTVGTSTKQGEENKHDDGDKAGEVYGMLRQVVAITVENSSLPSSPPPPPPIVKAFRFESKKRTISTFFQALPFSPKLLLQLEQIADLG